MFPTPDRIRIAQIALENEEFERGMISLAACTVPDVAAVTEAFKRWVASTPFPWRVALDYCLERAKRGKSLPFKVSLKYMED